MSFPPIKRATLHEKYHFKHPEHKVFGYFVSDLKEERLSRAKWAKELAEEVKVLMALYSASKCSVCYSYSKTALIIWRELLRVAEADEVV